jgi:hypothetical protein
MATTCELIAKVNVGSGGTSAILFDNIPATFTDLYLVHSLRTNRAAVVETMWGKLNGSTSDMTIRSIEPNGSTIANDSGSVIRLGNATGASATSDTFASSEIYIPNYAGSTNKSLSIVGVQETNATTAYMVISAVLWAQTSAITSIEIYSGFSNTIQEHSSAYLYGITKF